MDGLTLTMEAGIGRIALHRPAKRNALTQQMWEQLTDLARSASQDDTMRVLLIHSDVPGVFSAGADIGEYRANVGDVEWGLGSQRRVGAALGAIRSVPVPTIAVIDGPCVGGGAGIALACDFRLASDHASFAITPAKLGLIFPHEDIAALVDLVGAAPAKRILLTGSRFDADWALQVGFVDAVHPAGELVQAAEAWAQEVIAAAPGSVRAMKTIIGLVEQGVRTATPDTQRLVRAALAGPEHREGVTAFLEGRTANFTMSP